MKKRKVANLIMVILILVIAAAGVLTAGFIRGWFDHDAQAATLREIRGVVTMQRGGVAYPVDSDTVLRKGDTIVTSSRGTASIQIGESLISLNEKTELKVQESASAACALGMSAGEALGNICKPYHLDPGGGSAAASSGHRRLCQRPQRSPEPERLRRPGFLGRADGSGRANAELGRGYPFHRGGVPSGSE